jgi:hypothetical protein
MGMVCYIYNYLVCYLTEVGILLGGEENSTRQQMIDVIEFETQIANVSSL